MYIPSVLGSNGCYFWYLGDLDIFSKNAVEFVMTFNPSLRC